MMFLWAFVLLAVATSSVNSQCSRPSAYKEVIRKSCERHSHIFTDYKSKKESLGLTGLTGLLNPISEITDLLFIGVEYDTADISYTNNGWGYSSELKISAKCKELLDIIITVQIKCGLSLTLKKGCTYFDFNEDLLQIVVDVKGDKILGLLSVVLTALLQVLNTIIRSLVILLIRLIISDINYINEQVTGPYYLNDVECHHSFSSLSQADGYASTVVTSYFGDQPVTWGEGNNYDWKDGENQLWLLNGDIITPVVETAATAVTTTISLSPESWSTEPWGGQYSDLKLLYSVKKLTKCEFTKQGAIFYFVFGISLYDAQTLIISSEVEVSLNANTGYEYGYFGIELLAGIDIDLDVVIKSVDSGCGCGSVIPSWLKTHIHLNLNVFIDAVNCKCRSLLPLPATLGKPGSNGKCESQEGNCRCSSD